MSTLFPPYYSTVIKEGSKKLNQSWITFFYLHYLQNSGDVSISGDTLTSSRTIIVPSLSINGVQWPAPAPDYYLQKTSETELSWVAASAVTTSAPTGTVEIVPFSSAPTGWVLMNDGTIGNAASGATTRANADTENLFIELWNSCSDTNCPVSGGRGASAAADFAANKTIQLPQVVDSLIAAAGAGAGLTSRDLAAQVGSDDITIAEDEMPAHNHTLYGHGATSTGATNRQVARYDLASSSAGSLTMNTYIPDETVETAGSGLPNDPQDTFNVQQPSVRLNAIIKL